MDEISTVEAAAREKLPLSTVHRWLVKGRIPFRWAEGKRVMLTSDFDAYIKARAHYRGA